MMGKLRFNNSALLLLVAVVCGALAFFGARRYLVESTATVRQSWEQRYSPVPVLVAARDLQAGRNLQVADLARRAVPSAFVPRGAFRPADISRATGKPLLVPLGAGEPLVATHLLQNADPTLAARLRGGARAVTVPVDEVSSQAQLAIALRIGELIPMLRGESDVHPTRLASRGAGSSACTADTSTSTPPARRARGHSIEVVVGGEAAPGKTRHWFPGS
ncbi:MAG: Flp pilus assembly protein CpaB [Gammaproteobacteria bacterium]|nr:Flp pilus assembly protein CpaB [Gammaproteobacteria bacterium]